MTDPTIIIAVKAGVQAVAVAIIGGIFHVETRQRKKKDAEADARAEIRAEESRLAMKLMSANTSLTIATAIAVKEQKTNGKMETALEEAAKAQREYYDFINRVASAQIVTG
jgi:hypothetical protein